MTRKRSAAFARSDIQSAAEEFVQAVAEYAPTLWEPADVDSLAEALTGAALAVIQDTQTTFGAVHDGSAT